VLAAMSYKDLKTCFLTKSAPIEILTQSFFSMSSNVAKTIVRINFVFLIILLLALIAFLVLLNADESEFGPVTIVGSVMLCGAIAYTCVFLNWNLKLFREIRFQTTYRPRLDPDCSKDAVIILILGVVIPYFLIVADLIMVAGK
jgi:hypothetical protein